MATRNAILIGFMLAACGGGDGGGPSGPGTTNPPAGAPASAQIQMKSVIDPTGYSSESHSFDPGGTTIARGGTVTWVNASGISHNVTFTSSGAPSNIANHSSGSNSRTFPSAGTFSFACTNHSGMAGSVQVQ